MYNKLFFRCIINNFNLILYGLKIVVIILDFLIQIYFCINLCYGNFQIVYEFQKQK